MDTCPMASLRHGGQRIFLNPDVDQGAGERYGDVIERVLQDRKRQDFIAHLDKIAEEGEFVPLDSDPEYAALKKEMRCESKHRQAGAAVR